MNKNETLTTRYFYKSLFLLAVFGIVPMATSSAASKQQPAPVLFSEKISIASENGSATEETITANRIYVHSKGLFKRPVASFYYGATSIQIPTTQEIVIQATDTQALKKDFAQPKTHAFAEKSKIPALRGLRLLVKQAHAGKKIRAKLLLLDSPEKPLFVLIEKAQEKISTAPKVKSFSVIRVVVFGQESTISAYMLNLLKALILEDSYSTTTKVIGTLTVAVAAVAVADVATGNGLSNHLINMPRRMYPNEQPVNIERSTAPNIPRPDAPTGPQLPPPAHPTPPPIAEDLTFSEAEISQANAVAQALQNQLAARENVPNRINISYKTFRGLQLSRDTMGNLNYAYPAPNRQDDYTVYDYIAVDTACCSNTNSPLRARALVLAAKRLAQQSPNIGHKFLILYATEANKIQTICSQLRTEDVHFIIINNTRGAFTTADVRLQEQTTEKIYIVQNPGNIGSEVARWAYPVLPEI